MIWRAAIPLAALAAAGCTWGPGPDALQVVQVIPDGSTRGITRNVTLLGEGFPLEVQVDFDAPASSRVCSGLRAELRRSGSDPIPLELVQPISRTELRAHLSREGYLSAFVGTWDVVVIGSDGMEATIPQAFRVEGCDVLKQQCDDGEDACTTGKECTGMARCEGTAAADATPCSFECTDGAAVEGSCLQGACVPGAGLCDPPSACTAP